MKTWLMIVTAASAVGTGGPSLYTSQTCPGPAQIGLEAVTPGGDYALLTADSPGSATIWAGPCAGTVLDLDAATVRLRRVRTADAWGEDEMNLNFGGAACGLRVQVVDLTTCAVSNLSEL